jgi:hypothetical protein
VPKKVLPSEEDFAWIEWELRKLGFRPITRTEVGKAIVRQGLHPPRKRHGREAGFTFSANGLTVKVWTTWLREESRAREEDSAWVLIADGSDTVPYFSHPVHRTKNFARNLLRQAWIAHWRVLHRPLCPVCHEYMDIVSGKALKSRYYRCNRVATHPDGKVVTASWDLGLPKRAKQFVVAIRKKRSRNKGARAVLTRKTWHKKDQGSA